MMNNLLSISTDKYNVANIPSVVLETLISSVRAFANLSLQGLYLIDLYENKFLYVSDNPLLLCGHSVEEVQNLGYHFFEQHVPKAELSKLKEWNAEGLKFLEERNERDKALCSLSYHFHLDDGRHRRLVRQELTPIYFMPDGKIRLVLCSVSPSPYSSAGHVIVSHKTMFAHWHYSEVEHAWHACKNVKLNDTDMEIIRLSISGLNMKEIAEKLCLTEVAVKARKSKIFRKLDVSSISGAIVQAYLSKMF